MAMYLVTRRFIGGGLAGLTYTNATKVYMPVGLVVNHPIGGSPYEIIECLPIVELV